MKKLTIIDCEILFLNGLVSKRDRVKLLGRGELRSKITVKLHAFTKAAQVSVESLGGNIEIV